jgi:hypothetical protein
MWLYLCIFSILGIVYGMFVMVFLRRLFISLGSSFCFLLFSLWVGFVPAFFLFISLLFFPVI